MDEEVDIVERLRQRRGWGRLPTNNPYVLEAVMKELSPFRGRSLQLMSPAQVSSCIEQIYFSPRETQRVHAFRTMMRAGDVLVVGVPRVGQTPVLTILDYLRTGTLSTKRDAITHAAPWIEAPYGLRVAPEAPAPPPTANGNARPISSRTAASGSRANKAKLRQSRGPPGAAARFANQTTDDEADSDAEDAAARKKAFPPRLFKSYATPSTLLGTNDLTKRLPDGVKIVAVLRDPLDVRVSWFRHVRRLYRQLGPTTSTKQNTSDFDRVHHVEDFVRDVPMPTATTLQTQRDYEQYVSEVTHLLVSNPLSVCVVFYEELLASDLRVVVERLAAFTGWGALASKEFIADAVKDAVDHPVYGSHVGSSGSGIVVVPSDVARKLDNAWTTHVAIPHASIAMFAPQAAPKLATESYARLFESYTGKSWSVTGLPLRVAAVGHGGGKGMEEMSVFATGDSSGGAAARGSSLRSFLPRMSGLGPSPNATPASATAASLSAAASANANANANGERPPRPSGLSLRSIGRSASNMLGVSSPPSTSSASIPVVGRGGSPVDVVVNGTRERSSSRRFSFLRRQQSNPSRALHADPDDTDDDAPDRRSVARTTWARSTTSPTLGEVE